MLHKANSSRPESRSTLRAQELSYLGVDIADIADVDIADIADVDIADIADVDIAALSEVCLACEGRVHSGKLSVDGRLSGVGT